MNHQNHPHRGRLVWGVFIALTVWFCFAGFLYFQNPENHLNSWRAVKAVFGELGGSWQMPWQHFIAIIVFIFSVLTAEAIGRFVTKERFVFRLLVGWVLLGTLMLLVGALQLYYFPVFWGIALCGITSRWVMFRQDFVAYKKLIYINVPGALFAAVLFLLAMVYILAIGYALTPPIQSDGMRYHLAALQEFLKAGGIVYLPYNAFTNMPFLIEMNFLFALGLGSDVAPRLIHLSFLPLAAEILFLIFQGFIEPNLKTSECPWLRLFFHVTLVSIPVALIVSTWSFIDTGVLAFFLAMICFLLRWLKLRKPADLILCALFAGASVAAKYTMVVFSALSGLIVLVSLIQRKDSSKLALRPFLIFSGVALLICGPWFVKNAIFTGNPVYPLMNGIFKGGEWGETSQTLYGEKAGARGLHTLEGFFLAPVYTATRWTAHRNVKNPGRHIGLNYENQNPGPLFLMFLPVLLYAFAQTFLRKRKNSSQILLLAILLTFYIFWFFTYQSNRFALFIFALSLLWLAGVLLQLKQNARSIFIVCISALIICSTLGGLWSLEWMYARTPVRPLPYLLGFVDRDTYIETALPYTKAFHALEALTQDNDKTLFIGEYRGYHCKASYEANDFFDQPLILKYIKQGRGDGGIEQALLADGYTLIFVNWAELRLYMKDFQSFFTSSEWQEFESLLNSSSLKLIYEEKPGYYIYRIQAG